MRLADSAATQAAGRELSATIRSGDIIALYGDLGAGKTSFARGVIAGLGFEGEVPSPSFPIVIPYELPAVRLPIWHVDLYRINQPEDVDQLALDEALIDGALIIEWPQNMGDRLWSSALKLTISPISSGGRSLTVEAPPSWEGRCPFR